MKTKELIEYLQEFDAESEVVVIAANPKERKKYDGEMFGITDGGQPIFCIEISNESDLDEKEIAAAVQDEREAEQINVASWAAWNERQYPELKWLHHIPNGGSRNKAEAVKLKQMGVKAGVSDLCLPYPKGIYCGLYIEMKFGDGKHQKSQKEFLTDMAAVGHYVATCYTSEDAVEVLREYCELLSPQWMKEPNNSVWKEGTISPLKKK